MDGKIRAVVFDLDGCLYIGDSPVEGAAMAVDTLRRRGYRLVFLTNNSTLTRRSYSEKLSRMGIKADEDEIITSGVVAARYLSRTSPSARILPVTEEGFIEEARQLGLEILEIEDWRRATHVVSGLDRRLTYHKLSRACRAILSGARYLCTNPVNIYPSEDGLDPGAGAIAAAISKATGVEPLILGKPYDACAREVLIHLDVPPDTVVYVGDRLDTDIGLARRAGGVGVLVKTGLYEYIRAGDVEPDYVIDSVADLPGLLEEKLL